MSTKDNNESGLVFEARLFKSAASVESEVVIFCSECLYFVILVDGAEASLLGNTVFIGGAGYICNGRRVPPWLSAAWQSV